MDDYLYFFQSLLGKHAWLVQPLILLGLTGVFTYALHLFYRLVRPKLIRNNRYVINAMLRAIYWPLFIFIWLRAIVIATNTFVVKLDNTLVEFLQILQNIGLILLLAWVFVRFIRQFEELLLAGHLTQKKPDKTTLEATGKLLRALAFVIVTLFILPVIGIPVSGIVAFGGGSAIVVGIGAQQILANYFGGLVIYSDRHFKVGDWIYSPDKEIEGTVESIGWRSTQIRTFDQRPMYVPNAVFFTITVINASRMRHRRIQETIGIRYTDATKLDNITQEIRSMLQAHPEIAQGQTMLVHFTEFGPSSLKINVYTFTKTTNWEKYRDVQQDVFLKIIQIVERNGAALALPANDLYLKRT